MFYNIFFLFEVWTSLELDQPCAGRLILCIS